MSSCAVTAVGRSGPPGEPPGFSGAEQAGGRHAGARPPISRALREVFEVLISELDHAGYDSAARCLAEDLEALVAHLRYRLRHRERWRSTNLLESSLGEVRRRTKVMGRFPGETSCLSLVWAVLLREERDALDRLLAAADLLGIASFLLPDRAQALADRARRMRAQNEILKPGEF